MSCPVLSCPLPFSPSMSCLVFSYGCQFRILSVSAFAVSLFPCCRFVSVCLVFFLSVFVFCPRPCFEHLSTVHRLKGLHFTCSPTSRAHFTLVPTVCVSCDPRIAKWTQEPPRRPGINRRSQRPCVPPHALPNRSFLRPILCGVQAVSQLFHGCAAALHVDGSSHFSNDHCPHVRFWLERQNVWHLSDHVVCRVDVSSLGLNVLSPP